MFAPVMLLTRGEASLAVLLGGGCYLAKQLSTNPSVTLVAMLSYALMLLCTGSILLYRVRRRRSNSRVAVYASVAALFALALRSIWEAYAGFFAATATDTSAGVLPPLPATILSALSAAALWVWAHSELLLLLPLIAVSSMAFYSSPSEPVAASTSYSSRLMNGRRVPA